MEQATIEKGNVRAAYEQALAAWQRRNPNEQPTRLYVPLGGEEEAAKYADPLLFIAARAWMKGRVGIGL